ncbi:hypothetical protein [Streptomyces yaizuensis]|uniref:DUF4175 domain-containing protein n=1 Tax=Streptomyces yaizuensis TaxID=2989713 RepID=A0ABQ5P6X5_9ACTN|nr:hypothetical protein [Streptomyces sp. YSPA8]GLF98342.1 DUF4175 domain-containing protein [Streptomyces sp. YSPA8]
MPKMSGFDQRAVALIELRGTRSEHELFGNAVAEAGWAVLEDHGPVAAEPVAATPAVSVTSVVSVVSADERRRYTVDIRFPGSRVNAVKGARDRVEVLADALLLDLTVLVVDRVDRDPVDLPRWFAQSPPGGTAPGADAPRLRRWADRWTRWLAERLGTHDTGRLVGAVSAPDARRLARHPLPGARPPAPEATARGSLGTEPSRTPAQLGRRRESARMVTRMLIAGVVLLWVGARIADRSGDGPGAWWGFALVGLGAVWAIAAAARRMAPGRPLRETVAASLVPAVVIALAGANIVRTEPGAGWGSRVIAYGVIAGVVFNGVRLLARQWTWRRTAPWLLPAILPVSVGLVPPLGIGLHTFYLHAFDLSLDDVEVPQAYRFLATLKLMACMSLWLGALALLGYMKHLHLYVRDRLLGNLVLFTTALTLLYVGVFTLGIAAADRAGDEAKRDAAQGRTPSAYFGIEPEWVCVRPIGRPADIPVDGGELLPHRPYLRIGDAGGTVVLWDTEERQALKAPLDKLRVLPEDTRPASCHRPSPS